jgi:hypothetical protein
LRNRKAYREFCVKNDDWSSSTKQAWIAAEKAAAKTFSDELKGYVLEWFTAKLSAFGNKSAFDHIKDGDKDAVNDVIATFRRMGV